MTYEKPEINQVADAVEACREAPRSTLPRSTSADKPSTRTSPMKSDHQEGRLRPQASR